jgi:membrane-associated protein
MDFGIIFHQVISLTGAFSLWLVLAVFLMTLFGEFGISIPYLHETIWLLAGFHISGGSLAPQAILIFCLTSFIGRELGAMILYKISGLGSGRFLRFYCKLDALSSGWRQSPCRWKKYLLAPLVGLATRFLISNTRMKSSGNKLEMDLKCPVISMSPFRVALGRFIWLKIPLTITMGMTRQLFALLIGVGLFSLVWDGLYITIGVFSAGKGLSPALMLAITFGGFMGINILTYLIKRILAPARASHAA